MGTVSLTRLAVKTHRRLPACWWVWLLSVGFNTRRLSSCDIPEVPFFYQDTENFKNRAKWRGCGEAMSFPSPSVLM